MEKDIQNAIRLGVNDIAVTFRANVGKLYTDDGRMIATGLPKGFPDLFGYRKRTVKSSTAAIFGTGAERRLFSGGGKKCRRCQKNYIGNITPNWHAISGCVSG